MLAGSNSGDRLEDTELVRGFLAGEADACRRIDSWILLVVRNPRWADSLDADDMLQDIRLRLLGNLGKWRKESGLRTYVCRIAMYACASVLRKQCRNREDLGIDTAERIADPAPGPAEQLEKKEEEMALLKIVASAPAECRKLWEMIYFDCLPFEEIARHLAVKVGTVKSRNARYRETAKEKYETALKAREPIPAKLNYSGRGRCEPRPVPPGDSDD